MKKKILSFLIALTAVTGCIGGYSASADEMPETYYGHAEEINQDGYILKMKDSSQDISFTSLGINNYGGFYDILNVNLTEQEEIGYDGRLSADYSDEKFEGYSVQSEKTGYYYVTGGISYEKLSQNDDIDEIYDVYLVNRNGFNENYEAHELGGGYRKIFRHSDLLKNDADNNGEIDSSDALKILNAVVGNEKLSIKEKIQLGIYYSSDYVNYVDYYTLSSDKALEILYQIVGE